MKENKQRVDLIKQVYSKTGYPTIIDTNFNQLGNKSVNEQIDSSVSVEQFFDLYTQLFYEIPSYGEIASHEYLITTSTEYIGFEANNDIINALQKEITQLRKLSAPSTTGRPDKKQRRMIHRFKNVHDYNPDNDK